MPQPAPFWRRLAARVLDLLFSLVLTFVVAVPMSLLVVLVLLPIFGRDPLFAVGGAACYFLGYVAMEFFLLLRRDGQTLGKGLMGLRVVRSGDPHAPLSAVQAFVRLVVLLTPFVLSSLAGGDPGSAPKQALAGFGFLVVLAGLVLAAVPRTRRRAVHDLLGGTRVVRAPRRGLSLRQDVRMMLPGRVDMRKHA